jgi:hypothetical protein
VAADDGAEAPPAVVDAAAWGDVELATLGMTVTGLSAFRIPAWARRRGADGSGVVAAGGGGAESAEPVGLLAAGPATGATGPTGTVVGVGLGTSAAPLELVDCACGAVGVVAGWDAVERACVTSAVISVIADCRSAAALVAVALIACPAAVKGSADAGGCAAVSAVAAVANAVTGTS